MFCYVTSLLEKRNGVKINMDLFIFNCIYCFLRDFLVLVKAIDTWFLCQNAVNKILPCYF